MSKRGPGFGLFVSALALWSCARAKDDACSTCGLEPSQSTATPVPGVARHVGYCGDGIWDPKQEQCDDGSACRDGRECTDDRLRCLSTSAAACQPRSRDGCSEQCTVEPGFACREGRDCRPIGASVSEMLPMLGVPGPSDLPGTVVPADVPDAAALPGAAAGGSPDTRVAGGVPVPERCREPSFRAPELVTGLDPSRDLWAPSLAADGRTLLLAANQGQREHIYFATRALGSADFSALTLLAGVNSGSGDGAPLLSADGLSLYFYSRRAGGSGDRDLWFATRPDAAADFAAPSRFVATNSAALDHLPWVSRDELTMLYVSARPGGLGMADIWVARRDRRGDDFGEPEPFSAIDSSADEGRAVQTSDGNAVIFSSAREGGQGGQDLWFSLREDSGEPFAPPTNLSELNSPSPDLDPFLSADERELFFSSTRNGRAEVWRSLIDCGD